MNPTLKHLCIAIFALALVALPAFAASPYDGVNRIGTYYQMSSSYDYSYGSNMAYQHYAGRPMTISYQEYNRPAIAGGWSTMGSEYIVGIRPNVYATFTPTHHAEIYAPTCGRNCWWYGGTSGYPRVSTSSSYPQRTRWGGIYGY